MKSSSGITAASVPLNFLLLFSTSTRRPISNSFLTGRALLEAAVMCWISRDDFSAVYQYIYGNISYEVQNDYYVFPDSDARYLFHVDPGMSAQELCYGKTRFMPVIPDFPFLELTDYFATKPGIMKCSSVRFQFCGV